MFYLFTNDIGISKQAYLMFVRHPSTETKEMLLQTSDYQDFLLKCTRFFHLAFRTIHCFSRLRKHTLSIKGVDVLQVYIQPTIQSNERDRLDKRFKGSLAQMSVSPFFDQVMAIMVITAIHYREMFQHCQPAAKCSTCRIHLCKALHELFEYQPQSFNCKQHKLA